jgi:hypothetical protein
MPITWSCRAHLPLALVAVPLLGGCAKVLDSRYVQAATAAGLAVGAAAVNRAATRDCWAMCRPGTVCDHASGLCVAPGGARGDQGEHGPGRPGDEPAAPGTEYEVPALPLGDGGADAP